MKGCILPFPKKGDVGFAKNFRSITLTYIQSLLGNRREPKVDNRYF